MLKWLPSIRMTSLTANARLDRVKLVRQALSVPHFRWLQVLALASLLTAVGVGTFNLKLSVSDYDLGWHLKTGDWIVQHAAVPHNGLFTWTAADRPWAAYSWGYEVLLSRAYAWFGLLGVGWYGTLLTVGITYAIYWMARRLSGNFWMALFVALLTCAAFLYSMHPRPVFFSMILFAVTLALLLEARRTGREKLLYWLPLVLVLWANLHIQFVYGLFAVGLLVAVNLVQRSAESRGWKPAWLQPSTLPIAAPIVVLASCFVATCIGPYSYHVYGVIARYAEAKVPYRIIMELQPVNFRAGSHYVELLLMAFAFFAVGRQRQVDIFKLLLLCISGVMAFHSMRDGWFICITAGACIADGLADAVQSEPGGTWLESVAVWALVAVLWAVLAPRFDFSTAGLERAMSEYLPVNAVNYLRKHPAPGPLYNAINWGGFLIWQLPDRPVAIDDRTDLYGDKLEELSFRTAVGAPSWLNDPYLNEAGVVIVEQRSRLKALLETDPRFQLAYQDRLAALFFRR